MGAHGSWVIGWVGSTITAVTFLAIAALIASNLQRQHQWSRNPLAVGTFLIFLTCGGGHLIHTLQLLYIDLGASASIGQAARIHYGEWHLWVADGATALAGTAYLALRRAFPDLVSGAAMFEDLRSRQKNALAIHDSVVQELAKAKWNLDLGRDDAAKKALEAAAHASQRIIQTMENA